MFDDDVEVGINRGRFVLLAPTDCAWELVSLSREGRALSASLSR